MGFRFRKSIKILPGVKINLTKNGISSASIGKSGANINIGKKGTRTTVGIPGSGLSYSKYKAYQNRSVTPNRTSSDDLTPPQTASQADEQNHQPQSNANRGLSGGAIVLIIVIAFILGAILF